MKIVYGLNNLKRYKRPVVALGVFDGVHRGHAKILQAAVRKAKQIKGTSIALTFCPHPQKEESLCSLEHRLRLISEIGLDVSIVINFNRHFAKLSAEDFVKEILFKKIHADYIYVGKNFKFGKGARGDKRTLKRLSTTYRFRLMLSNVLKIKNIPISSTQIRALIKKGDLNRAKDLLGRPVSVLGTVVKGISLAQTLGFPTANIKSHHEITPPAGIYAVDVIFNNKRFHGACYIGNRPTFREIIKRQNALAKKNIEVFILEFNKNIYGKYLEISFLNKIREEKKFASKETLAQAIKKDIDLLKHRFSHH